MTKSILVFALGIFMCSPAFAQEYGALIGVHQTTADSDQTGVSTDGKFNFKAGLAVNFGLADNMRFRTGAIYDQRHFEIKGSGTSIDVNFDYIDVPALFQYNFNEMVGLFGGLVVGVNVNDDVKYPAGATATDPDADKLIPLISLGANFLFQDMIGFDVYYERGLGGIAQNLENYSTFGANFIYWF